jgi:uncharacterized protein (TIGR00730 family)
MKSICVYCGSSHGNGAQYADAARALAAEMAARKLSLVYGGGNVGLMGVIADEVLRLGGEVTGVIPQGLMDKEVGHRALTHLHIVRDMHERKAKMAQWADGFIALPGGIGTLEELFEVLTWSQLGYHDKPVGILNVNGFYDRLVDFIGHLVEEGFVRPQHASLLIHETDAGALLRRFECFQPVYGDKLLHRGAARTLLP